MAKNVMFLTKLIALLLAIYFLSSFDIDDETIKVIIETAIFYFKKVWVFMYREYKKG